jgi:hypothetical protein
MNHKSITLFTSLILITMIILIITVLYKIKSNLFKTEHFEVDCVSYPFLCMNEYPEIIKQYSSFPLVKTNTIIDMNKKVK